MVPMTINAWQKIPLRLLLVLLFLSIPSQVSAAETYKLDNQNSEAQFKSDAALNTFYGKTRSLSGWVKLDPQHIDRTEAEFSVDLASIKTGNRLRDKHMREKFLETTLHPQMNFKLERVLTTEKKILPDVPQPIKIQGSFSLHGVTRSEVIDLTIHHDQSQHTLKIQGTFPIDLSTYKIKQPSFMDMFVENVLPVTIDLVLR